MCYDFGLPCFAAWSSFLPLVKTKLPSCTSLAVSTAHKLHAYKSRRNTQIVTYTLYQMCMFTAHQLHAPVLHLHGLEVVWVRTDGTVHCRVVDDLSMTHTHAHTTHTPRSVQTACIAVLSSGSQTHTQRPWHYHTHSVQLGSVLATRACALGCYTVLTNITKQCVRTWIVKVASVAAMKQRQAVLRDQKEQACTRIQTHKHTHTRARAVM